MKPTMARKVTAGRKSRANQGLSELDWAILDELTHDPHASARAVAERLNQPIAQVSSRIRALDRKNASRVLAVLDLKAAGQYFCFIQISVRGRSLDELASEMTVIAEALMVSALSGGANDLLVLVRFRDLSTLHRIVYETIARVAGVSEFSVSIVLDVPVFHSRYVTISASYTPLDVQESMQDLALNYDASVMDELDRCIVAELQQNARRSINSIARNYDINASTIRYRIRSLENRGLMRFITVLEPPVLGLTTFTLIEVHTHANQIAEVTASLADSPWLPQLFHCAGPASILGIALTDSPETMKQIKSQELSMIPGVERVEVSTLIKTYKIDLRWAQRFT
jgi:Lrp/AsnC family transcriptional regulator for asnA, asnC and gidA